MADQEAARWLESRPPAETQLPHDSEPWNTSGGRPLRESLPFRPPDPWATKSVLSIDGGGIRGYSSLVILQALMETVGAIERARNPMATSSVHSSALGPLDDAICAAPASATWGYWPCHYFDYVAGVGTGGIIAVMLGRCRMTVAEAMGKYRELCAGVVKRQPTSRRPPFVRRDPILSTKDKGLRWAKARTVKLVPAWPGPDEDERNLESDPERCGTIVCGCDSYLEPFRSYPSPEPRKHAVSDVISRCLRAAPPHGADIDAGHYYNNPSRTVLAEVSSFLKRESPGDDGTDLVNIDGTFDQPVLPREEDDDDDGDELQYQGVDLSSMSGFIKNNPVDQPPWAGGPQSQGIDLLSIGGAVTEPVEPIHQPREQEAPKDSERSTDDPDGSGVALATLGPDNLLQARMSNQVRRVHEELSERFRRRKLNTYCRLDLLLNDDDDDDEDDDDYNGLDDIGINDWEPGTARVDAETFGRIEAATRTYLSHETTRRRLGRFAAALVDRRRRRAETLGWERCTFFFLFFSFLFRMSHSFPPFYFGRPGGLFF